MALENLRLTLAGAGATPRDRVSVTTYIVDFEPEQLAVYVPALNNFFDPDNLPACSMLGISALAQRGGFVHTNHFLAQPGSGDAELVPGSAHRFDRAHQLLDGADSLNITTLKHIFLDKSEGDHSISCNYHEDPSLAG